MQYAVRGEENPSILNLKSLTITFNGTYGTQKNNKKHAKHITQQAENLNHQALMCDQCSNSYSIHLEVYFQLRISLFTIFHPSPNISSSHLEVN